MIDNFVTHKREDWADYVKCFAIYLMVLCHFNLSDADARQFIWMFHMPVFFLISGYFDKGVSLDWTYLKKSYRTLMVPYFFFSVLSFSYCWVSPYLHPESYHYGTMPQTFLKAFIGMFLMEDVVRPYAFMPCLAAWFLAALFEIKVFFALLCLCWRKCRVVVPLLLFLPFSIVYFDVPFFSMDSASLGLIFYAIGYFMKKYNVLQYLNSRIVSLVLAVILCAYLWFIGMKNGIINLDGGEWGNNFWMFCINGLLGSLFCIAMAQSINVHVPIISEIGQSTLSILGTHGLIGIIGKTFCVYFLASDPRNFPILATVILSIIALLFGVMVQRYLTIHLPWAVGKSTVKQ